MIILQFKSVLNYIYQPSRTAVAAYMSDHSGNQCGSKYLKIIDPGQHNRDHAGLKSTVTFSTSYNKYHETTNKLIFYELEQVYYVSAKVKGNIQICLIAIILSLLDEIKINFTFCVMSCIYLYEILTQYSYIGSVFLQLFCCIE